MKFLLLAKEFLPNVLTVISRNVTLKIPKILYLYVLVAKPQFMLFVIIAIAVITIVAGLLIIGRKGNDSLSSEGIRKSSSLQDTLEELRGSVESALEEISSLYRYGHYITESERLSLIAKYKELYDRVDKFVYRKQFQKCEGIEPFIRFNKALSDSKGFKDVNNKQFIERELALNAQYFDSVLAYPLDPQQREAIVSLEDNVLVISSAGSGKTMTTVGKVRYLIDKQGIDPSRILLITFTRKAAASLSERLGENKLKCVTFHKLALSIIAEATGEKPSITEADFPVQVYNDLMEKDKDFRHAISDYIIGSRYKMRDPFEYASYQEYMEDRKKYGIQAYFRDMDNRSVFCKSDEESKICDFLGERGIKFRYEERYEVNVSDPEHRQYKPDFSIYFKDKNGVDRRIYLEHFGVDETGHVPKWFGEGTELSYIEADQQYRAGMLWKRALHKEKGTTLIETSSADFHRGNVFELLDRQLKRCGIEEYSFSSDKDSISRELAKQEENILNMLTAFNFLLKSKGMNSSSIMSLGIGRKDKITINQIIRPYIAAYEKREQELNEIDFIDAINKATQICNKGRLHEYDYILVDEFQDISLDRYRFLQSLRSATPMTKLFCVGDDWQSIYRFAGSDMGLFKDFEKYFGYTKECRMETTYRFGEPLIRRSSDFILHNPAQKTKEVHPFNDESSTRLEFVGVSDNMQLVEKVVELLDSIPAEKEVYILGRYSFNINFFKNSPLRINTNKTSLSYNGRTIQYMTVHQSKGLESDYVILVGCDSGTLGFPSEIADPEVLKYVLSSPDNYEYGEERRVFYVGITRAKKITYVLYNQSKPSVFVKEFIAPPTEEKEQVDEIPESERCPRCKCGRVLEAHRGVAVNGNPYTVLRCSNEKFGCDYRETVFVNLNQRSRRR